MLCAEMTSQRRQGRQIPEITKDVFGVWWDLILSENTDKIVKYIRNVFSDIIVKTKFTNCSYHSVMMAAGVRYWLTNCGGTVWWLHAMETLPQLMALSAGKPYVTGGFPAQRASISYFWQYLFCLFGQVFDQSSKWWNELTFLLMQRHRNQQFIQVLRNSIVYTTNSIMMILIDPFIYLRRPACHHIPMNVVKINAELFVDYQQHSRYNHATILMWSSSQRSPFVHTWFFVVGYKMKEFYIIVITRPHTKTNTYSTAIKFTRRCD